jgi:dolichol-phosphate mannosyltransferase
MGIGSAHLHAIFKAYSENYAILVTLDADLTHSPENINNMILSLNSADVATSSRFLNRSDLDGWNLRRKATTHLGHLLTKVLLGLPYDSSSGFRAYNLANIPERCFELVRNSGYSFFFESLKILDLNKVAIVDVPMNLPPRTYGSSKMKLKDIISSVKILVTFAYETKVNKEKFIS